jgi:hypothetical protein
MDLAGVLASFWGSTGRWQGAVAPAVQEPAQAQNPVSDRHPDEAATAEKGGPVAILPWDDPTQVHSFNCGRAFDPGSS